MYSSDDISIRSYRFEDLRVGLEMGFSHTLTQADVDAFAALTGDFNPIHLSHEFARKTSFQKPVVFGMLSASFISRLIGTLLPGKGALWVSQSLEFLQPAFVGDDLAVSGKIKQKSEASRTIVIEVSVKNQHGHPLISGESTVRLTMVEETKPKIEGKKVILVTGATGGIGSEVCLRLAQEGHTVVVNYHREDARAEGLVAQIRQSNGMAIAKRANVSDLEALRALFRDVESQVGPISGLVHCAAPVPIPKRAEQLVWEDVQSQIDTQVKGAFHCVQLAVPKMKELGSGSIILVGSVFADGVPPKEQLPYVVTKSAIASLTRALAVELGPFGIRVNTVSPGMTETPMIAHLPEKTKMWAKMSTPLRKLAKPGDIAGVVAFLMGPDATHICGENIRISGGISMG